MPALGLGATGGGSGAVPLAGGSHFGVWVDLGLVFWPWLATPHTSPSGCPWPQAWPVSLHKTHIKLLA